MLDFTTMLDIYNTGSLSLSILQAMQIQIWKKGKKRVHPPFCTRLYDLFLKVYFLENWFLALFQFMKIWKTREKCFFYSVVSAHIPFAVFSQGGFYRTEKENLVYLFNTINGKTKTNFYYHTVKTKQNLNKL